MIIRGSYVQCSIHVHVHKLVKFLGASQQQKNCKFHQIFIVSDKTTHKAFIIHKTLFQTKPIGDFFLSSLFTKTILWLFKCSMTHFASDLGRSCKEI